MVHCAGNLMAYEVWQMFIQALGYTAVLVDPVAPKTVRRESVGTALIVGYGRAELVGGEPDIEAKPKGS